MVFPERASSRVEQCAEGFFRRRAVDPVELGEDRVGRNAMHEAVDDVRRLFAGFRERLLDFLASHPRCVVAMEACAGAHQWGREIGQLGHEVRLLPPIYVKPFVKRHKNDMADAEAICEAAQRPTMRFVAVKSEEQQARGMLFHTRDLLPPPPERAAKGGEPSGVVKRRRKPTAPGSPWI